MKTFVEETSMKVKERRFCVAKTSAETKPKSSSLRQGQPRSTFDTIDVGGEDHTHKPNAYCVAMTKVTDKRPAYYSCKEHTHTHTS